MRKQNKTNSEPVLLTTVSSNYQLGLVQSILEEHNIPCLAQDRASGGYMRVYAGGSIFGTDIYVAPENLEEARELLDVLVLTIWRKFLRTSSQKKLWKQEARRTNFAY